MTVTSPTAAPNGAPKGRKITAQGKERSDAALGHRPHNMSSPEGAKQLGERLSCLVTPLRSAEIIAADLPKQVNYSAMDETNYWTRFPQPKYHGEKAK